MCVAWLSEVDSEAPLKHFLGKSCKIYSFGGSGSVFTLILFLGSAVCGYCDEFPMVSVPLGFEISGYDRSRIWVSENRVFAFGFLDGSYKDDSFDGFVVGIRYNLGTKAANLPVWTVGGGLRVPENSTLSLSMDGRLVLFENPNGFILWSSNTSSSGVQKASLLNNGNLVLMGAGDKVVWESFNSPTSTLLPGQSLHFPQTLSAPSTKSVSSYYNFVIRHSGDLALIWETNVTYWKSHLSSSATVTEARFDSNGVLGLIDVANKTVWSKSSKDFGDPSVVFRHLRIDPDGNLRMYSWDSVLYTWRVGWQAVENQCSVFGFCGLYSLCGYNSSGPVCNCIVQDSSNWETGTPIMDYGGLSCKKMVDLGNCKMGTSMMVLKGTVLYGLYPPHDVDTMLSEDACKQFCSNDTTCMAVTSRNDGSGVCTVKRTSFISGYRYPSLPAISYLKVCLIPQAATVQGAHPHFSLLPERMNVPGVISMQFLRAVSLIIFVTILGFLVIEIFVVWFIYRRRKIKALSRIPFGKDAQMNPHYSILIRLSFEEIKELTSNFASQLGTTVFKGILPNKTPVIAKILEDVVASEKDFRVAVSTLGGMHHRNLVPLKGFCFEPNHKLLLYEYVPNGSLNEWLFNSKEDQNEGNWQQRLAIALGVARALAYLHLECQKCIPHGNLKLENVLLDKKLVPKVTDFGLWSVCPKEAASSSETRSERDIYMFGKMLLQLVMGKRDIWGDNLHHLVNKMNQKLELEGSEEWEGVERVVRIALWCMQSQPFLRPSIGEVLKVLKGTVSVDRPPLDFAFHQEN
ncbi:G-type lectin S-receptor-like serine/threonine-protein kinase SD3-1 [Malania oleifera]|uniref:G-type lectin S-receptor-like serine/threonine-protein kinase SD3-1 n=1 Tax=Malania oleifera TaxID=397392 RepID=UPI0025AEC648|nr:G-type lectin S-receptor-like serine/threonine-protein kinase SD3-1 [Malania oleifera]